MHFYLFIQVNIYLIFIFFFFLHFNCWVCFSRLMVTLYSNCRPISRHAPLILGIFCWRILVPSVAQRFTTLWVRNIALFAKARCNLNPNHNPNYTLPQPSFSFQTKLTRCRILRFGIKSRSWSVFKRQECGPSRIQNLVRLYTFLS